MNFEGQWKEWTQPSIEIYGKRHFDSDKHLPNLMFIHLILPKTSKQKEKTTIQSGILIEADKLDNQNSNGSGWMVTVSLCI